MHKFLSHSDGPAGLGKGTKRVERLCGQGELVYDGVEAFGRGDLSVFNVEEGSFIPGDETTDGFGTPGSIEDHQGFANLSVPGAQSVGGFPRNIDFLKRSMPSCHVVSIHSIAPIVTKETVYGPRQRTKTVSPQERSGSANRFVSPAEMPRPRCATVRVSTGAWLSSGCGCCQLLGGVVGRDGQLAGLGRLVDGDGQSQDPGAVVRLDVVCIEGLP